MTIICICQDNGFLALKKLDKKHVGIFCEIESRMMMIASKKYGKSGFSGRKYAFNIFWAASVNHRCRIRHPQIALFRPITAAQKMLNCRIYRPQKTPLNTKMLIMNGLQKTATIALFTPKVFLFGKLPAICAHFVIKN